MSTLPKLSLTAHCAERQRTRHISDDDLDLTVRYGTRLHVTGAVIYYLRRRDMPLWMDDDNAARMHGLVVVASRDGAALTTYRNPKVLRRLKKLPRWGKSGARKSA